MDFSGIVWNLCLWSHPSYIGHLHAVAVDYHTIWFFFDCQFRKLQNKYSIPSTVPNYHSLFRRKKVLNWKKSRYQDFEIYLKKITFAFDFLTFLGVIIVWAINWTMVTSIRWPRIIAQTISCLTTTSTSYRANIPSKPFSPTTMNYQRNLYIV